LAAALEPYGRSAAARRAGAALGGAVAGGLLAAVQYLPLADAVGRSLRASQYVAPLGLSLHPLRLFEVVYPMPYGNTTVVPGNYLPWIAAFSEGREPIVVSLYFGAAAIVLCAVGTVFGERRRVLVWGTLGVVALL